ncbi:hypothetical protein C1H46_011973 [Malus baccata]|uniref:Uncharacterized protein n=1 Tax=Malus baccata TaxID=106549 RepID=A0A540MUI8_MALBA|nr:hypothetical protein C1H46_011973 [Malus baccata]
MEGGPFGKGEDRKFARDNDKWPRIQQILPINHTTHLSRKEFNTYKMEWPKEIPQFYKQNVEYF